jgi:hypothetical protein
MTIGMSQLLSVSMLVICAALLVFHFVDIKNSRKRNG